MNQVIIYKQPSGRIAIFGPPTEEVLALYSIEEIADTIVPAGLPYKIINASELPADRSQRDAWTVDDAELTDGTGSVSNEFGSVA